MVDTADTKGYNKQCKGSKTRPTGLMLTCYTLLCTIMVILYNFNYNLIINYIILIISGSYGGHRRFTTDNRQRQGYGIRSPQVS